MAQFDVHRNTGRHRETIPYVVVVQSSMYDGYRRRVVVPLADKALLGAVSDGGFNPSFTIENSEVVLHPLEIVSIPKEQLGPWVASLAEEGEAILQALDQLLSRTWQ
ncbi:CcdB family protein [Methylogaea oryzae]|uniref:Toxin CcdB n=1 Tax=Methylogaea oryzae TaxID=1295382 RepID=A0A8D5AJ22_9GAMM|nr:CcdB family protein [Methylogaea oryzae]BBL71966.1 CcdB cytotoxin-like protein [Methylogaea oryzae]